MNEFVANIIAGLAFVISIITFYSQYTFNRHSLMPACKIDVYSIGGSIKIVFQNVGNGLMEVKKIEYFERNSEIPIKNLSSWLAELPAVANSEYNLDETYVGQGMQYNLLSRTVSTQEDLDATWRKLKNLRIKVQYKGSYKMLRPYTHEYKLDIDYEVYLYAKGKRNIV